jgi:ABC-type transport system substrate-binding protein
MLVSRRSFLLASATLPFLRGVSPAASASGKLVFGLSSYPPNLEPWRHTGTAAGAVKQLIFRGLTSFGPDGQLRGELAESWEPSGETGWVFRLRDAVFHNGAPVTAEDVKWTIEQVAAEKSTAYLKGEFQGVQEIRTPDQRTVHLVMKEPTVTVPLWFANFNMPIIARGTTENPVGAGPFVLKGQERGVALDLEAFDRFFKPDLPKLKSIRFVAYADENLRVAALQAGDVDIIDYVPWQSMDAIEADQKLKLTTVNGPFMGLIFNGRTGPFTDARVRQAVAFAVRREEIVKAAFFGRGAPLEGIPLTPGTPYFDEARSRHWRYNPKHAKALLADAGVPNGFSCTLLSTAQYGMHKQTAEVVQQHLTEIGIQVKLNLPDWATRLTLGGRGQYDFAVVGDSALNPDPDGIAFLLDAELPESISRSYGMSTPKLHELFVQGRSIFDPAKRREIYAQMEQEALEQATFVGLAWRSQGYAMAKKVEGFHNLPGSLTFASGITLEGTSVG